MGKARRKNNTGDASRRICAGTFLLSCAALAASAGISLAPEEDLATRENRVPEQPAQNAQTPLLQRTETPRNESYTISASLSGLEDQTGTLQNISERPRMTLDEIGEEFIAARSKKDSWVILETPAVNTEMAEYEQ